MVSMRRRLRGITTRVSALVDAPPPSPAEPDVPDTGGVPVITVDPVLAASVDLARRAAREAAGTKVGPHLGAEDEDDLVVTHSFASLDPAYVGWRWAVTVTRAPDAEHVTVDEVVLLPGEGALLAPSWVPWSERVQPQDLAPGDLLPPAPDDARLAPAYTEVEEELAAETFWELGLGRPRTLSFEGRATTADRWYDGEHGPFTPMARQAPGQCLDCGFRVPLGGSLAKLFGVCGNAFAPDDGRVVSLDHGCGAHSEVVVEATQGPGAGLVVEDEVLELVALGQAPDDETPDGHAS
ncbi:MAG TPA: DUF3027 domain-containing protein [Mycobacteriales bacterium]|nr:DUF3027 domain-containing protein [Mycobacteriales bacterium]